MSDVRVAVAGPTTWVMSCQTAQTDTTCSWDGGPVQSGTYSLQLSAPGVQPQTVTATLTITPSASGPGCSCGDVKLEPSAVTLQKS